MIHFDWTYKKEFVPIYMQNNMTIETLDLTKILTIEEVDSNFSCQLTQVHSQDHIKVFFVVVVVDFICNFDSSWYPFDTQYCFLNISLDGSYGMYVTLCWLLAQQIFHQFMRWKYGHH